MLSLVIGLSETPTKENKKMRMTNELKTKVLEVSIKLTNLLVENLDNYEDVCDFDHDEKREDITNSILAYDELKEDYYNIYTNDKISMTELIEYKIMELLDIKEHDIFSYMFDMCRGELLRKAVEYEKLNNL